MLGTSLRTRGSFLAEVSGRGGRDPWGRVQLSHSKYTSLTSTYCGGIHPELVLNLSYTFAHLIPTTYRVHIRLIS